MCVFVMKYLYIKYETKLFYFACMSVIAISEKQYNSNVHFLFSNFPEVFLLTVLRQLLGYSSWTSVVSYITFVLSLFLICPSLGA